MSTVYSLWQDGSGDWIGIEERSGKVGFLVSVHDTDTEEINCYGTNAVLDENDLINMVVEIIKVASYISEEPESIRAKVHKAIGNDDYLGLMTY